MLLMTLFDTFASQEDELTASLHIRTRLDINTCAEMAHRDTVNALIDAWVCAKINGDVPCYWPATFNIKDIPAVCEKLHINFLNSSFENNGAYARRVRSKKRLSENGAVYTPTHVACEMVKRILSAHQGDIPDMLDFACGTGRFYEQAVRVLMEMRGISADEIILNHLFAVDMDPIAVSITRLKALSMLAHPDRRKMDQINSMIICKNALIHNDTLMGNASAIGTSDLCGKSRHGFDVIFSNPPYLVLKPTKKIDTERSEKLSRMVEYFRNCGAYPLSTEGMLNLYQLSIERMLSMLKDKGEMGVICPSTLFADSSATKLRKHLLLKHQIREIVYYPENISLFDNVAQATTIFYLKKRGKTSFIRMKTGGKSFSINLELAKLLFPSKLELPFVSETEWIILEKLAKFIKLKDLSGIRNRRGELDLSLYSKYITKKPTPYRLVRGNMITVNALRDINHEYVDEKFLSVKSEDFMKNDFGRERLICQQISNAGQRVRLKFAWCGRNDILGNSCNYISGERKILSKLFLLLNSAILNWRFKITSCNNHINNYELDELPVPDLDKVDGSFHYSTHAELDAYIGGLYGLTEKEIACVSG